MPRIEQATCRAESKRDLHGERNGRRVMETAVVKPRRRLDPASVLAVHLRSPEFTASYGGHPSRAGWLGSLCGLMVTLRLSLRAKNGLPSEARRASGRERRMVPVRGFEPRSRG